jgi:hypothetical protein
MTRDVPLFGARNKARELATEVETLRAELDRLGGLDILELKRQKGELEVELREQRKALGREGAELRTTIDELQKRGGCHRGSRDPPRGRLLRVPPPPRRLARIPRRTKAAEHTHKEHGQDRWRRGWWIDHLGRRCLSKQGPKNGSRFLETHASGIQRRSRQSGAGNEALQTGFSSQPSDQSRSDDRSLGQTMGIHIAQEYHDLRVRELELTADYREKKAQEKEQEREENARLREEQRAQKEMERERTKLEKERKHYLSALEALMARGDEEGAARLRDELSDVEKAIEDVDYRAAISERDTSTLFPTLARLARAS